VGGSSKGDVHVHVVVHVKVQVHVKVKVKVHDQGRTAARGKGAAQWDRLLRPLLAAPKKLYCYPRSPYTVKVLVAAYEKNVSFDGLMEFVPPFDKNAMGRMRTQEKEPFAQVPLMLLEDGTHLMDSATMIDYLELRHPAPPHVIPRDEEAALHARGLDRFAEHIIGAITYLSFALRAPTPNSEKIAATFATLGQLLATYEGLLKERPFLGGDAFTLADLGAVAACETIMRGRDQDGIDRAGLDPYPHVKRWFERIGSRPSWARLVVDIEKSPMLGKYVPA